MNAFDKRAYPRRETDEITTCVLQGMAWSVVMSNVSEGGCQLEGDDLALIPGARASVRIAEFGSVDGTVIWAVGNRGGIAFDAPLHNAVVAFIANRTNATVGVVDAPRDRFGRMLPTPPSLPRFEDLFRA